MKKKPLLIGLLFLFTNAFSQNTFPTSGNAGVGTVSPVGTLQIIGSEQSPDGTTLILGSTGSSNLRLGYNTSYSWIQSHGGMPLYINELGNNALINPVYGRVGIGTFVPQAKLDVRGSLTKSEYGIIIPTLNIFSNDESSVGTGGAIAFGGKTGNANPEYTFAFLTGAKETMQSGNYAGYFAIHTVSGGENGEVMSANYERLRIGSNGNVGIGTTDPKGHKLSVNGKIRAQEIKVEAANWPDYVFTKDYKLLTLQEVEKQIEEKGHLPSIPSAMEVNANGIDLGEMNAKLLQKIEELTLYLIEIKKENKEMKMSVLRQNIEIERINYKIKALK